MKYHRLCLDVVHILGNIPSFLSVLITKHADCSANLQMSIISAYDLPVR